MSKNILIIGGTGFIGYHLAKRCIKKKWKVTSVSTSKPKKIRYLSKIKYLYFDISKKKNLIKYLKTNFDYVVNLGGHVDHSKKKKTLESHYNGCKNLIDFFEKTRIKSFLQIGSSVEYGNKKSPQKENLFINIKSLKSSYGRAKLLATNYLLKKNKINSFPGNVIRFYLVYGPKQDFNRLIPLVIKGCLENKNFPCSSGKQYRDFLYVDDAVNGILKCLENDKLNGEIVNIGYGRPKRVEKLIKLIKKKISLGNPIFGKIKLRKDEINILYPDIKKARNKLNWKPKVEFIKGIGKTIKYYKNNFSIHS